MSAGKVAVILAASKQTAPISQSVLSALTFNHPSSASGIAISLPFMAGWVLVILGALIRDACYRYLGRQFTFQLALLKGHKLVTDGPYAVVRHPSYTGWIIHTTGLLVIQTCRGSWIAECGLLNTLVGRTWREDEALREQFGEQWEQWSSRTAYRLLPGVF
ncbi:hypothetical protein BN946_scf184884.g9 [Trametes cinnabarina]|uniref:Protein-S-isoprenylcysteine O-methyltransferase n=1 Tax=Pycnoporus cinnabarinus TaxID=5643 RepID=A0A060S689_PYCCI|nr:hypothetical protein BN946_scf184884.g9 [Trametes cinnabarina]